MNQEFEFPVRVYIEDTDAGGIVYYVNYLKFFERARTEWLRSLGFGKGAMLEDGLLFVVRNAQVDYHRPARLDDELSVGIEILKIARTYVMFRQTIKREDELLCRAEIQVACVNDKMKPSAIPMPVRLAMANKEQQSDPAVSYKDEDKAEV